MKELPKSLLERQEKEQLKTADIVTQAISELKAEGYEIKIRDIIEVTGLSRSVFAKPHVRQILIEHGIVKLQDTPASHENNNKCNTKMLLAKKDEYIQKLLNENNQLQYEIELLRGKIHILMHKIEAKNENMT